MVWAARMATLSEPLFTDVYSGVRLIRRTNQPLRCPAAGFRLHARRCSEMRSSLRSRLCDRRQGASSPTYAGSLKLSSGACRTAPRGAPSQPGWGHGGWRPRRSSAGSARRLGAPTILAYGACRNTSVNGKRNGILRSNRSPVGRRAPTSAPLPSHLKSSLA